MVGMVFRFHGLEVSGFVIPRFSGDGCFAGTELPRPHDTRPRARRKQSIHDSWLMERRRSSAIDHGACGDLAAELTARFPDDPHPIHTVYIRRYVIQRRTRYDVGNSLTVRLAKPLTPMRKQRHNVSGQPCRMPARGQQQQWDCNVAMSESRRWSWTLVAEAVNR